MEGKRMTYQPEANVPERLDLEHIGQRVVFHKSESSTLLSEGEVMEFSPSKNYVNLSGRWVENRKGIILSILEPAKKRTNPYDDSE